MTTTTTVAPKTTKTTITKATLKTLKAQRVRAFSSLYRNDDDDDGCPEDDEDDDHEGHPQDHQGREAHEGQGCSVREREEERCGHEEEGRAHLRPEAAQRCVGGYLRCEEAPAHRGHEEDLGLHQEARAQRWPHDQAGCGLEGGHAGCELGHVEDGFLRQQALVLRPWARRCATDGYLCLTLI